MFEMESIIDISCCRLVKYDEYLDSLEHSFEGEEEMPISTLLGGVKATYSFDLLLETRRPDQIFQPYKPGGKFNFINVKHPSRPFPLLVVLNMNYCEYIFLQFFLIYGH